MERTENIESPRYQVMFTTHIGRDDNQSQVVC